MATTLSPSAPAVDLSRLPAPIAIETLDFETILDERIADLRARLPEFDALLESDPAFKLQEVDTYRELILRARINDATRSVMLAFAGGADLDQLAAFYGITRLVIGEASGAVPVQLEEDAALRRRILLAPEAFAGAGSRDAWAFHALSADPRVLNADIWSPLPGAVTVAVQSRDEDGLASAELLDIVRTQLNRPDIKPLTDTVNVRSVVNIDYAMSIQAFILPGPSPELVRAEVAASLRRMADARRTPGRDVPRSAIVAAASIDPVDRVTVQTPAADIAKAHGEVALCSAIDVEVMVHDG